MMKEILKDHNPFLDTLKEKQEQYLAAAQAHQKSNDAQTTDTTTSSTDEESAETQNVEL